MAKISTILPSGSSGISLTNISAIQPILYNNNTGVISSNKSSFTEDGYLSKIDWNTFNSKQDKLNGTGFVKASGETIIYDDSVYLTASDLPSTLNLYATTTTSDVIGYNVLVRNISDTRYNTLSVDVSTGAITTTNQLVGSLITDDNIISGNPGIFDLKTTGNIRRTSGSGEAVFFFRIYKRTSGGTETLIAQSDNTIPVIDGGAYVEFSATALWNDGIFLSTDRVVLKYYASRLSGGSNPTYDFQFGGTTPVRSVAAVPTSVIPNIYLKDLTDVENVDALNNEILYWNDTSSLWEHSLAENLVPNASATQKGLITTSTQIFAGTKTFNQDLIVSGINVGRGGSITSALIGGGALQNNISGNSNVAIGHQALFTTTNASSLVAVGQGALFANTTGSAGVAVGAESLNSNTTGNSNTAIGRESLKANTIGFQNTAVGRSALLLNINGNNNVAFGYFALLNNILGSGNIAIGSNALLSSTSNNNVAIGLNALQNNTSGGSNIGIGQGTSTLSITNTNSIVIGNGTVGLGSNTTVIGTPTTSVTGLYGNIRLVTGMATAPASSTATGTLGDIRVTDGFIYICTATNTWVRTQLTTW